MRKLSYTAWLRVVVALVVAVLVGVGLAFARQAALIPMGAWVGFAATYCLVTWLTIRKMSPSECKDHATREDPGRGAAHIILLLACMGSLLGVALLLAGAQDKGNGIVEALLGVCGVIASWFVVHTLYTARYAGIYYSGKPAVDYGDDDPDYGDFAYLAFTLGMTYQVSDTTLKTREIRRAALGHALVSYLLGAVVLACTINLVVQLASSGN